MKRFFLLSLLFMLQTALFAQGGVDFRSLSFQEALDAAKSENKLVFVDCYTSWCGPCQMMMRDIFPKKGAGDYFNPKFVCVKYDMEKGEGPDLVRKYKVVAYPTFLILRPDGTELHRVVGGATLEDFIAKVDKGCDGHGTLADLSAGYARGRLSRQDLMAYYVALTEAAEEKKAAAVHKELGERLRKRDRLDPFYWPYFQQTAFGSEDFSFLIDNLDRLNASVGEDKVDALMDNIYYGQLFDFFFNGTTDGSKALKASITGLGTSRQPAYLTLYTMIEGLWEKDTAKVLDVLEANIQEMKLAEIRLTFSIFQQLRNHAGRKVMGRMAEDLDRLVSLQEDPKSVEYLRPWICEYRMAASEGVLFWDLPLKEALELAGRMNRRVFVDCYTSWCGPCRQMLKEVFPREDVGDFINGRFLAVKYDMEKNEGPALMAKYGVKAFPTFLILNTDGSVYHKMVGGAAPEDFMRKAGVGPDRASGMLETGYNKGNRDKAFLSNYVKCLAEAHDNGAAAVAGELFGLLNEGERLSPDYWFLFEVRDVMTRQPEMADYMLEHRQDYCRNIGTEKVEGLIAMKYLRIMKPMLILKKRLDVRMLDRAAREIRTLGLAKGRTLLGNISIAKALVRGSLTEVLSCCARELRHMPTEDFLYYMLVGDKVEKEGTPAQKKKWCTLVRQLADKAVHQGMKKRMEMDLVRLSAE